jgi:hypothetical protein
VAGLAASVDAVLAAFAGRTWNGAPLRVTDDANVVNPPCVWVPMPSLDFRFQKRCIDVTWTAFLIAPNTNTTSVSRTLSGLLDAVVGLFPFLEGTAQPLTPPGGGQPNDRIPIGA